MRSILFTAVFALINLVSFGVCEPATITPSTPQTICAGGSVILSTAVLTNATYQWNLNGLVVGTNSATYTATSSGSYTVTVSGAADGAGGTCDVSTSLETIVTVNPLPTATITPASATTFCQGGSVALNANTGAGLTYQWKKDGSNLSGATTSSYSANTSGSYTVVVTNASSCSATSGAIIVTVNTLPSAPTSPLPNSRCGAGTVSLSATAPSGSTIDWYSAASGGTLLFSSSTSFTTPSISTTTIYYAEARNTTTGCVSATRTAVTASVNALPIAPNSLNNFSRCGTGTLTLSATAPSGSTIDWYSAASGGTLLFSSSISYTTPSISTTTIYYAEARNTTTGCVSATRTAVTATVNVVPVVGNISLTICSGAGFSETPQNGGSNVIPAGTQYSWTVSNADVIGESVSVTLQTSIAQQALTNSSLTDQVVEYAVTPEALACPGNSFTVSVTVSTNSIPVLNDPIDQNLCAGSSTASVNFTVSPVIPNTIYNWTNSNPSIGIGASGSGNITSFPATNSTNAAVTSNIVVTPSYTVSGLTCTGVSQTFIFTVKPLPSMTSSSSLSVCSGATWSIPLNSNITSTYTWQATSNTNVGGESAIVQTSGTVSDLLTNTTITDQVVNYSVIPTANGCPGSPQSVSVTVKPLPSMTSLNSSNICSGSPLNFQLTSNITSSYTWLATSNGNVGGESTTSQSSSAINNTLTNSTLVDQTVVYSVIPTANGCPGSQQSVSITVKPLPSMTSLNAASICSGIPLNFQLTSSIASSYTWLATSNGNVGGESTASQSSSIINNSLTNSTLVDQTVVYSVIPTSNGCPGSPQSVSVTVKPLPSMTSLNSSSICSGSPLNFQLTSNITSSYTWLATSNGNVGGESLSSQNTSIINNTLSHLSNSNQVVDYIVTPTANGCQGSIQTVSITVKPKPSITSNLQQTICSEQQFTFTPENNTNGIVPANTTLTWTVSNSNVTGEQSNTNSGVGTLNQTLTNTNYANNQVVYTVTPVANSCTGNSFDYTVTVNKAPNLSVTPTSTICDGNSIQLFAVDAFNTGQLFYSWSNASTLNSSFIFNPIATPQTSTTYTVSATDNTTLCQVSRNVTVNVFQQVANISYTSPTSFCQGGSVTLTANSGVGLSYQWKINGTDIPGATSINYPAISSGVYTVMVTNTNGCVKTSMGQTVIVNSLPIADISNLSTTTFCQGESVIFNTTNVVGNIYQWKLNGSNIPGATLYSYEASLSGSYSVVVTNTNSCSLQSPSVSVTVHSLPVLSVSADDYNLCVGESTNLNVTGASSYSWTPAGLVSNSNAASPAVYPTSTTNFGVTGTDQNGCSNYEEIQITVVPNPTLDLPNTIEACEGSVVSLPGSAAIDWSGITPIAEFTAQQSGYAIATLQNSNLCSAIDSIYLQVNPLPTPDITGSEAVCANAHYSEYSVVSSGNAYSWNVSNGELQGIDNGNTAYIHWYDMEYGPSTFVTMIEHDNITGCEGSDTLFVTFSGLAPNTTNVNLLDPSGSTLYAEDHFAIMNWGATIISNNVDEYTNGHAQYYTFENFDTALRYYWIEAGDDSLCLTRSYYNAPVWQVGVEENQDFSAVNIYPNPTSGVLNISHDSNFELSSVKVYDMTGHLIKENLYFRNQNLFDVSELPSGFYILKLVSSSGQSVNKTFVKE